MTVIYAYEFSFVGAYDEAVFSECPYATDALRERVIKVCDAITSVFNKSPGIMNMAMPLTHDGKNFKIRLARSDQTE